MLLIPLVGLAQTPTPAPAIADPPAGTVFLDEQPLFVLYDRHTFRSLETRAQTVSRRVKTLAQTPSLAVDSLKVGEQGGEVVLFYNATLLTPITTADAEAVNLPRRTLAERYAKTIRSQTTAYRERHNQVVSRPPLRQIPQFSQVWQTITTLSERGGTVNYPIAIAYTLLATVMLVLAIRGINQIFPLVYRFIRKAQRQRWLEIHIYQIRFLSSVQVGRGLMVLAQLVRLALFLLTCLVYAIVVLNLYPLTQQLGRRLYGYSQTALGQVVGSVVDYIPSALIVTVIILLTSYTLRIIKPIFNQLGQEKIKLKGFYPEWAEPTYRLVEILVFAIAAVLCFPYLPGFGSDAFQSLSIFLGVLVSLGSTTAVANAVSGVILIYTRAFRLGDYIAVGEAKGSVEEKSILVTRIRTPNNVIVTIPNAMLIANNIQNYSISGRDTAQPVVLTTTITLGYDVPWDLIYRTLISAAQQVPLVLAEPAPEVWQTGLGDFSVSYELRVYTDRPDQEPQIHSALHQQMQDACNTADIEILSPTYSAIRDGNTSTIPENYLPADYKADGFKLNPLGNLFKVDLHWGQQGKGKGKTKPSPNGRSMG
ncbi:MAG: mechanosensitive ion channel family protein [Spirulinaceae cyanobacterium]